MIRQQIIALFLTASVAFPSCGLVKTPAEKVSEQIAELSELSTITEAAILEAEEAFEALSEEERAEVENADDIAAARERLEAQRLERQKADARAVYAGEWVELAEVLGVNRPIVYWFGPLTLRPDGTGESDGSEWTWDISEDLTGLRLSGNRGKVTLNVVRDGAFTELQDPNGRYVLLRTTEAEKYVNARFVKIDVTGDSIGEVMDLPVCTGPILDEKDKPTGSSAWIQPSRKIDQGLVYYGRSEDFYYTITVNGNTAEQWRLEVPFDSLAAPEYTHFQRGSSAGGTLVFIRAAYVTENRMSDGRTRVLMLSDGMKYTTSQNWYVDVVDYQGHEY
ncbi:MAG: hypothetical protein J6S60_00055 [Oscillospiraceae bacterium]|nr:hypothetical protein [Oscillospiraceae bacterium]